MTETTTPEAVPPMDKQVIYVRGRYFTSLTRSGVDMRDFDAALTILGIELRVDDGPAPSVREVPGGEAREISGREIRFGDRVSGVYVEKLPEGASSSDGTAAYLEIAGDCGYIAELTVSRPVSPLPDKPGAVIRDVASDWTIEDGRSNSSDAFRRISADIETIIRNSAWDLLNNRADVVARVILARVAHVHHLEPAGAGVDQGGKR